MNAPTQRVADSINKVNQDSCAWALRHVIDEALALVQHPNCTVPEMKALLEFGKGVADDFLDKHATCTIKGMGA